MREYLLVLFLGVTAQVEGERALAASLVVFRSYSLCASPVGYYISINRPGPRRRQTRILLPGLKLDEAVGGGVTRP